MIIKASFSFRKYILSKKLGILLTLIIIFSIILSLGFIVTIFLLRSSLNYPYPYYFQRNFNPFQKSLSLPKSEILIIGDKMGEKLYTFQKTILKNISQGEKIHHKLSSIAQAGEGLHRSLAKLKALPFRPEIIIYHGGSDEFQEIAYKYSQFDLLQKNIKRFKSPISKGLLKKFPWMSKFIFLPMEKKLLEQDIPKQLAQVPDHLVFQSLQMNNGLYYLHLSELIDYTKKNNIKLIFIPTPINLEVLPKKVCKPTSVDSIITLQNEAFELYKKKDFKIAISKIQKLIPLTPGNALSYFLLGSTQKEIGLWNEARTNLEYAANLDCGMWRTSLLNNQTMIDIANKYNIKVIDFHALIHLFWGQNTLFIDEIYPQNFYYELLSEGLGLAIREILKI